MIDNEGVAELVALADRVGLSNRAIREIERVAQLELVEAGLRVRYPERLDRVERLAAQVLGDEAGWQWLRRFNRALGGVPIELVAEHEESASRVVTVLGRIDHGVFT